VKMAASMRPLTLGEILDRTVQLYRHHFLLLCGIAVPAAALTVAITGSVVIFLSSRTSAFTLPGKPGQIGQPPVFSPEAIMTIGSVAFLFFLIGIPLILGVFAMAFSALSFAANQVNRGEPTTIRASYGFAFRNFWRHIGVLFFQSLLAGVVPFGVMTVLTIVGAIIAALVARSGAGDSLTPFFVVLMVLLLIVWIVASALVWLRVSLAYPASVVEDKKAWESITRSNQLSNGTRGRIFVMFLLVYVLTFVVSVALTVPLDLVIAIAMRKSFTGNQLPAMFLTLLQFANLSISFLVRVFVMPIYSTALLLFYFDQRTRIEGYDIEQLMAQAGWPEIPPPPPALEIAYQYSRETEPESVFPLAESVQTETETLKPIPKRGDS
jgi:hypothetical protein